jgi:ribose-phosphate pyrophosphokinase
MKKNRCNLKIIAFENCKDLGEKVATKIEKMLNLDESIITNVECSRFNNGEGKLYIREDIRNKDLYVLSDVGNYSISYDFYGNRHNMSPDEHYQDIKRVISATNGRFSKISVVMPLLYQSRQHRRKERESLDCALALQELESLGVNNIITFDCHDPNVSNAIPNLPFENVFATETIIKDIFKNEDINKSNMLTISPDMGAMERARYYAEILGCDVGLFYKRRDLSKLIDGKNPVIEHIYLGKNPKDAVVFVIDDMIASGGSMLDVAKELKARGAKKIILVATFTLFTAGIEKFQKAYNNGLFDRLYTTNLTYVPENIKSLDWFNEVDCSEQLARIIIEHVEKGKIEEIKIEDERNLIKNINNE